MAMPGWVSAYDRSVDAWPCMTQHQSISGRVTISSHTSVPPYTKSNTSKHETRYSGSSYCCARIQSVLAKVTDPNRTSCSVRDSSCTRVTSVECILCSSCSLLLGYLRLQCIALLICRYPVWWRLASSARQLTPISGVSFCRVPSAFLRPASATAVNATVR